VLASNSVTRPPPAASAAASVRRSERAVCASGVPTLRAAASQRCRYGGAGHRENVLLSTAAIRRAALSGRRIECARGSGLCLPITPTHSTKAKAGYADAKECQGAGLRNLAEAGAAEVGATGTAVVGAAII
jgi:hypothetical protein